MIRPGRATPVPDGLGQSIVDDLRWLIRFRAARRLSVTWRSPDASERARWEDHPLIGRFGDLCGVAVTQARTWVLRERLWHGWPDPPRFAWFAMCGDRVWAAADFAAWPRGWAPPPTTSAPP